MLKYQRIYLIGKNSIFKVKSCNSSLNIIRKNQLHICFGFFPLQRSNANHATLINRSCRKRIAGRKRHAETDKVVLGEYIGRRTVPRYTSDASIILIVFQPSDENKHEGTFYASGNFFVLLADHCGSNDR